MARRCLLLVLVAAAVPVAAGCGGPMEPQELARSVQTLESSAAEGALLANGVARDRTKATFVRAHSRDLGETVEHEAEKLSDADANGEVAVRKSQAVDLAGRISQALGDLQTSPRSEDEGATAERELRRAAKRAAEISDAL
jgi:hypothetical protein